MDPVIYRRKVDGEQVIDWPHPKQQEILHRVLSRNSPEVLLLDLALGRMFGKTTVCIDIAQALLNLGGDQRGYFYEPNWARIADSFWPQWEEMIPRSMYRVNRNDRVITWLPTGAKMYYGVRAITGSSGSTEDKGRGPNVNFIIDDEAAMGFNEAQYLNALASVRKKNRAGIYAYITSSTPRLGPYADMVQSAGHVLVRGTSYDNPHANLALIEQLKDRMSPAMFEREILAMFNALSGAIWDMVDLGNTWPNGNLDALHPKYDPDLPFYVLCDIGSATGAYSIVQPVDAVIGGRRVFEGPRWVVVADFCPSMDANVRRAFELIRMQFGIPAGVVAGADINSEVSTDGKTSSYFVEKVFGRIPIFPCNEAVYNQRLRVDTLGSLFKTVSGHRRITIAKDFISLDRNSRRGVIEMIKQDVWLEPEKRRPGDYVPKNREILVQHIRDALMMGGVMLMAPPTWGLDRIEAA